MMKIMHTPNTRSRYDRKQVEEWPERQLNIK